MPSSRPRHRWRSPSRLIATGATAVFNPLIAGVVEQAKLLFLQQNPGLAKDLNEVAAKMRTDLQPRFNELNDEVARLYATNFTEQELKDILAFYQSPAGKKLLVTQPKVIDASMAFARPGRFCRSYCLFASGHPLVAPSNPLVPSHGFV